MPDVKIKGYSAEFTYKDVPMLWLADPSQEIGEPVEGETPNLIPFTYGRAVAKTVTPNFSGGDMAVPITDGELVNQLTITKPADLIPENIPEGKYIAGVGPGTFAGGGETESTSFDYTNARATIIGDHAFYGMDNLRSVTFSKATYICEGAFRGCTGLVSASFPKVTEIADATGNILSIGNNYVFGNCKSLTDISLPEVVTIGKGAFNGCDMLKSLELPAAQAIKSVPPNLETAKFPAVLTIGAGMFYDCSALRHVDTGATTIEYDVSTQKPPFMGCTALDTLILRSKTVVTASAVNLDDTPIASGTGYIYVLAALVEAYKADTYCSKYASQIRAIEDYPDICG